MWVRTTLNRVNEAAIAGLVDNASGNT